MGGNGPNNSSRVTTQQFYQAQLETNKEIADMALLQSEERAAMELRLMEKIGGVPTQVQTNKDEITRLRNSSNIKDIAVAIGAAIGSGLAAVIGSKQ